MKKNFFYIALISSFIWAQEFALPWGVVAIKDPALISMIEHPTMQRLKKIDVSGPVAYLGLMPKFSRFEHSIGVLALLHDKAQTQFDEQLAGLFHDSSHSAFSHIADHLFDIPNSEHSYQDTVHLNFLKNVGVDKSTEIFGITLDSLNPDKPEYQALEQPLPDLCADRIEYLLHTASKLHHLSPEEITAIVSDLQFKDGRWFFRDKILAEKFARLSTHFTKELYGSTWNSGIYEVFSRILKDAIIEGVLTQEQICYGHDREVLDTISTHGSASLKTRLEKLEQNPDSLYEVTTDPAKAECWIRPKFRGVDPWVRCANGEFHRLTELSEDYKKDYLLVRDWCATGYGLIFEKQVSL